MFGGPRARSAAVRLNTELAMMLSAIEDNHSVADSAGLETEDEARIERLLAGLCDGVVGQRVAEAASLAVAAHMAQTTQAVWSAVEAENSTK